MRREMQHETELSDLDTLQSMTSGTFFYEIALLRNWQYVREKLQLQVILYLPLSQVPTAMLTLNRGRNNGPWNQCSNGVQIYGNFRPDGENNTLSVQRNVCRRITAAIRNLQPARISFALCFTGLDSLIQMVRTPLMPLHPNSNQINADLYFIHEDSQVVIGNTGLVLGDGADRCTLKYSLTLGPYYICNELCLLQPSAVCSGAVELQSVY
ncbi:hypothetical protein GUITHDRAFT_118962 [Guillardia theta CCMP2712]|uniref:Uncharacterized protein n=1 Tax=Guillardia theta (strain CCMP2712) TaxID=905079 RepID=L1IFR9_GUITC|nr:hypothetical protein GUITHDRAFT_118962 [Guillardia theta CCMP2712]EKX34917.1 hypothetical protein GUITHDRAFT_118962 [Guillardia theta CCMP2712]|eukprot:XP_005821897.1 hypothetical protein GUITHDRAFT_118962 [Guillardia theta CCMP2712]